MRFQGSLSALAALAVTGAAGDPVTGKLGNATVVVNNPPGVVYAATFPETAFFKDAYPAGGNIKGSVAAVANLNGVGVIFKVILSNLPTEGGPFIYHIHDQPVPASGNCTETLAHLDPFQRGEVPACDASLPETCQVGDLSGKHGKIPSTSTDQTYTDYYAATLPGIGAFFGNRSVVVHFANTTRITCANFAVVPGTTGLSPPAPSGNCTTAGSTAYSTGVLPTTGAPSTTSTFVTVSGASSGGPVALLALGSMALLATVISML
ncbi:superoxide dismutase protein [Pleurostoma richardsiae]|uniref:superoxide dismutase n=1 Tax=Pleurostoma richardsiae TaxID=41990 RepID=A0AA38VXX3_9PEZI|nr:superoxide dismutase protein [Pleurostoma richardsiae]